MSCVGSAEAPMTATLRGLRSLRDCFHFRHSFEADFGEERHYRLTMLRARVTDALRLAALPEYLLRRRLEALVENGLAERKRRRGTLG